MYMQMIFYKMHDSNKASETNYPMICTTSNYIDFSRFNSSPLPASPNLRRVYSANESWFTWFAINQSHISWKTPLVHVYLTMTTHQCNQQLSLQIIVVNFHYSWLSNFVIYWWSKLLTTSLYNFSIGWTESQNTYVDA